MAIEPNPELVKIFDTEQESEAMVVKGLLDSAGIESVMISIDAPQEVLPGVGGVVLQVRPEQADAARKLIDDYRNSAASEPEVTEESAQPE